MIYISNFAGYRQHSAVPWWFYGGLLASVVLHLLLVYAYINKPQNIHITPPAAAPMAVVLNMPFASPEFNKNQQDKNQQAIKQKAGAQKPKPEPKPLPKPKVKQPTHKSTIQLPKKTPEKIKPVKKPPKKIIKKTAEVKEQGNAAATVNQAAKVAASIKTDRRADQLQAPTRGRMSKSMLKARMNWLGILFAHVERFKEYPRDARRLGIEGAPKVEMVLNRQGKLLRATLVQSSGNSQLDAEAVAMLERASPLPPPPENIKGDPLTITVPIRFKL